jgi:lipoate-protein ligase B
MLFSEIITVRSENHTNTINALREQNSELVNVKAGGKYTYHFELKD